MLSIITYIQFLALLVAVQAVAINKLELLNFLNGVVTPEDIENIISGAGGIQDVLGNNKFTPPNEANSKFWLDLAESEVNRRLQQNLNLNKAKNIIFFLGDGMSLNTVTAARIRKGQLKGELGEGDSLSFENFPYFGMSKTYCANAQVADSSCTATAYMCGVKANIASVGVSAKVQYNNCSASMDPANHVSSLAAWAQKAGKATGIITTSTLTDASPSGNYAHAANRFWQCDSDIDTSIPGLDSSTCMDIAQQLITQEPGRNFDLLLGGGMTKFLPQTTADFHGKMGERSDGKNLLSTWQAMHPAGRIVGNRQDLLSLNTSKIENVFGLFNSLYMDFHESANSMLQPTLMEMTEFAINFLKQKSDKGYYIFIENDHIDLAHHINTAGLALDEALEFDKAIELARALTDPSDTLIIVTADHAHPFSISGYPGRGSDILGLNQHDLDANNQNYTTLNYAAGPEQYLDEHGKRLDLTGIFDNNLRALYPSYIPASIGVHGGEDVGIYASGPHEHLFRGVIEQHAIPHMLAYAACIGDGPQLCDAGSEI